MSSVAELAQNAVVGYNDVIFVSPYSACKLFKLLKTATEKVYVEIGGERFCVTTEQVCDADGWNDYVVFKIAGVEVCRIEVCD